MNKGMYMYKYLSQSYSTMEWGLLHFAGRLSWIQLLNHYPISFTKGNTIIELCMSLPYKLQ